MNSYSRDHRSKVMFICITIASMSLLAFEISLARLLSILLSYHYVFGISSVAMLGSGIGAFVIHYRRGSLREEDLSTFYHNIVGRLSLSALSMVLTIFTVIVISRAAVGNILLFGFLLSIPFIWGGMFLADIFRMFPAISGKIYFADLFGAALGCVVVVFALNQLGGFESVTFFAALVSVMAVILSIQNKSGKKRHLLPLGTLIIIVGLMAVSFNQHPIVEIPIGSNIDKEIYDSLHVFNGEIIDTRWSAFGRTDLIQYKDLPHHMDIYLDGTAGTPMYQFNGDMNNPPEHIEELRDFPGYFPFQFLGEDEKERALIIGSGGGRDVLISMLGGIQKITAIEVNQNLVNIVNDYDWYNGGIYSSLEHIQIIVDEGRSYLRSHDQDNFDIIMLTLPVTNTSRSREGYALTENYLFTTDSIREYLGLLNDNGQLVVVANDDAEILRLLTLALTTFEEMGVDHQTAMQSVYILGSWPNPVFVLKNGVFSDDVMDQIYQAAMQDRNNNPQTSFFPVTEDSDRLMNPVLYGLATAQIQLDDMIGMVAGMGYDIRPVTDNNPFFYKLTVGLPESMRLVLVAAMFLMIIMTTILMVFERDLMGEGRLRKRRTQTSKPNPITFIAIFASLGLGYMIVEISMIQKFVFFLGKPILSLTVILFSVLLGTGVGSYLSNMIKDEDIFSWFKRGSLAVPVVLLLYNYVLIPVLFHHFLGIDLVGRTVLSILLLLPLSIVMGIPFPLVIRGLNIADMGHLIPWMWGINAVSSVLGSVMAMVLAILMGFNEAIIAGAICYLIANVAARTIRNKLAISR